MSAPRLSKPTYLPFVPSHRQDSAPSSGPTPPQTCFVEHVTAICVPGDPLGQSYGPGVTPPGVMETLGSSTFGLHSVRCLPAATGCTRVKFFPFGKVCHGHCLPYLPCVVTTQHTVGLCLFSGLAVGGSRKLSCRAGGAGGTARGLRRQQQRGGAGGKDLQTVALGFLTSLEPPTDLH